MSAEAFEALLRWLNKYLQELVAMFTHVGEWLGKIPGRLFPDAEEDE